MRSRSFLIPGLFIGLLVAACGSSGNAVDLDAVDAKRDASGGTGASGGNAFGGGPNGGAGSGSGGAGQVPGPPGLANTDDPDGTVASLRLVAPDQGVEYDAVGRVVSTDGEDPALQPLAGHNQFWFAWSIFHHGSPVFKADGSETTVTTAALQSDTECAVPCDEVQLACPGKDCIPALTDPTLVAPDSSETEYLSPESYVVGVEVNGDARAYPHNILWWHEIVNDLVGGEPIAVTHCPLTWSSLAFDPTRFSSAGTRVELGVSGRLYNSNLVFYDRNDDTWFSQLLGRGTVGPRLGEVTHKIHVWEMTWAAWKALFPKTTVLSSNTGHARNYEAPGYPYGGYFSDNENLFRAPSPSPDEAFPAKALTYALSLQSGEKAWVHEELERAAGGPVGVVNDEVGGVEVAVVFDLKAGYVQAFDRTGLGNLELKK